MGKKLGNALIIYGILNFLFSLVLGIPILIIGALIWMIIMIAIGNWQRSKARAEKARDKQTELLKRVADKLDEKDKTEPDNGIRYTKDQLMTMNKWRKGSVLLSMDLKRIKKLGWRARVNTLDQL